MIGFLVNDVQLMEGKPVGETAIVEETRPIATNWLM
jgi:hypothetical protein